jgi:acyl carrier protein
MTDTETKIRSFIAENFLFREDKASIAEDQSLLEAGLIDSTGVLELVGYLESEFKIRMEDAEIVPSNLDSLKAIVAFVKGKLAASMAA